MDIRKALQGKGSIFLSKDDSVSFNEETLLEKIRREKPLVHNITSDVVANDVANTCLALGATTVLTEETQDFKDLLPITSAIVLNLGKLSPTKLTAIEYLLSFKHIKNIPVVLDPVGVGTFSWRRKATFRLLRTGMIDLVKGNAGEIAALAGVAWTPKGVDAGEGSSDIGRIVKDLANEYACIFASSGPIDYLSDGDRVYLQNNGHSMLTMMTGSGCILSAVLACFLSVAGAEYFVAACDAFDFFNVTGERIFAKNPHQGPATFRTSFIDGIYLMNSQTVREFRRGSWQ